MSHNQKEKEKEAMKAFERLKRWLSGSHHWEHLIGGVFLFGIFAAMCIVLGISGTPTIVIGTFAVTAVAVSVEMKDWMWGGEFDLTDIWATIAVPVIALVIAVIYTVFALIFK